MKVDVGLQQSLDPGSREKAALLLRDCATGYWKGDPQMPHPHGGTFVLPDTKTHILVPHKRYCDTLCHCPHRSDENVYLSMHVVPDLVQCGNCQRIYLSLLKRTFYGN